MATERADAGYEYVLALAADHSLATLEARQEALLERVQTYQDQCGVDALTEIDATTTETTSELADRTAARANLRRASSSPVR